MDKYHKTKMEVIFYV